VIAPAEWRDKALDKDWSDLASLPWVATPPGSAHRRLIDDVFRPLGILPKRVAFADQEEAMIDLVEAGVCLGLARDAVLEQRPPGERKFVIADQVILTCDLGFVCLTSRRYEPAIAYAFAAMQAVWDARPVQPMPERETSETPLMTAAK
jgi:DNA-binding transcriptional LysR family regulator